MQGWLALANVVSFLLLGTQAEPQNARETDSVHKLSSSARYVSIDPTQSLHLAKAAQLSSAGQLKDLELAANQALKDARAANREQVRRSEDVSQAATKAAKADVHEDPQKEHWLRKKGTAAASSNGKSKLK